MNGGSSGRFHPCATLAMKRMQEAVGNPDQLFVALLRSPPNMLVEQKSCSTTFQEVINLDSNGI